MKDTVTSHQPFQGRIRVMRESGVRDVRAHQAVRCEDLLTHCRHTEIAFDYLDRIESAIERWADDFVEAAPGFQVCHVLRDGGYQTALHLEEQNGFSRIEFLVRLDPQIQRFQLSCRRTVRNREAGSGSLHATMNPRGLVRLRRFLMSQFLEYAEQFFGLTPVCA